MKIHALASVYLIVALLGVAGIVHSSLNDGLVAYYEFENDTKDSLGNYQANQQGDVNYLGGINGQAISLNGSGYATVIPAPHISKAFSVCFWMNVNTLSGATSDGHTIYSSEDKISWTGFGIRHDNDGIAVFINNGDQLSRKLFSSDGFLSLSDWYFVAVIYDEFNLKVVYNNLNSVLSETYGEYIPYNESATLFKHNSSYTQFYNGKIDSLRIYNRAISESEILELYRQDGVCDDIYDEGFEAGKQYCINNPKACGLSTDGCTQTDLNTQYQEGYDDGCEACSDGTVQAATISSELLIHIPALQYVTPFGAMYLWADFVYFGENNGDLLWKLSDFGQK